MVRESTRMSNGLREPDVEFPILEDDPPQPGLHQSSRFLC